MTQLTVNELLNFVTKETYFKNFLLKYLDFYGGNEGLQNDPEHHGLERVVALTGDEVVTGDYLIFCSCGHDTRYWVESCESLEEVEQELLGGAGITNSFRDQMGVNNEH